MFLLAAFLVNPKARRLKLFGTVGTFDLFPTRRHCTRSRRGLSTIIDKPRRSPDAFAVPCDHVSSLVDLVQFSRHSAPFTFPHHCSLVPTPHTSPQQRCRQLCLHYHLQLNRKPISFRLLGAVFQLSHRRLLPSLSVPATTTHAHSPNHHFVSITMASTC